MNLKKKRTFFFLIWIILLLSGPVSVFKNTPLRDIFSNNILFLNVFQRIVGLTAYVLIFVQIMLGAHMDRLVQILGAKAYKAHVTQGLLTYGFIFIHPLFYYVISYEIIGRFELFPDSGSIYDVWLTYGRAAFSLATIGVFAGYFRTKPFFRKYWRVFHLLNYLVFIFVTIHAFKIGTDTRTLPFAVVFYLATLLVGLTIIFRLFAYLDLRFNFKIRENKLQDKARD